MVRPAPGLSRFAIPLAGSRLGSGMKRWIEVEQPPAAFTIEQRAFSYLVPKLRTQRHLAGKAALPFGACKRRLTGRRSDAVVLGKKGLVNPFTELVSLLFKSSH